MTPRDFYLTVPWSFYDVLQSFEEKNLENAFFYE